MAKVTITIEDGPNGKGIIFAMVSEPPFLAENPVPPTQAQLVAAGLVNGLMASAGPQSTPPPAATP